MSTERAPIPSLDGLRAFAVLTVLAAHLLEQAKVPNFIPGSFGVTIFFFLSGYLITTLMRVEQDTTHTVALGQFYLRRVFRILPPFYLVLFVATAATALGWLPNVLDGRAVLAQALHLTNYLVVVQGWWVGIAPGTFIFWSLAVEEHFYLVFPWLFLAVSRVWTTRRSQAFVMLVLCGAVLLWRCVLVFAFHATKDRIYPATDTRFDSILYGCALALYGNPSLDPTRISERTWKRVLLPLGLAGLVVSFVVRAPWFLETFRYTLQGICLVPLYVVAVRYPTWGVMRALNVGWVKQVGLISYPLYLIHPAVLEAIDFQLHPSTPVLFVLAPVLCLLIATGIYRFVELPMARLRKRLSARSKVRDARGATASLASGRPSVT